MPKAIEYTNEMWKKFYGNLKNEETVDGRVRLMSQIINPKHYDHQSKIVLDFILDKDIKNILEIGGAFGGLALILMKYFHVPYTLVDNSPMTEFAKTYLKNRAARIIESKDMKSIEAEEFDLIISNQCLSEVPDSFKEYVYEKFISKAKHSFIIDPSIDEQYVQETHDIEEVAYEDFHYALNIYYLTRKDCHVG